MPGNNYNGNPSHIPTSRVERLIRERQEKNLKKTSRALHQNELTDNTVGPDLHGHELRVRDGDNFGPCTAEQDSEVAAKVPNDGFERLDGKPFTRQRLLVVANRLPVSAVRRGEDSWSLEISAGGLVSALLGKCY